MVIIVQTQGSCNRHGDDFVDVDSLFVVAPIDCGMLVLDPYFVMLSFLV